MYARVPQAMAQFVLKIEKLSHIMVPTPILEMAPAYGLRPRLWLLVEYYLLYLESVEEYSKGKIQLLHLNITSQCDNIYHEIWKADINILVLLNMWVYGNWRRHATQSSINQTGMDFVTEISFCKTPVVDEERLFLEVESQLGKSYKVSG